MKIKQTIAILCMLGAAAQVHAMATKEDSQRCIQAPLQMQPEEDGCTGNACSRAALVCVPRAWWTANGRDIPAGAHAPLVLVFHGRGNEDISFIQDADIKAKIANTPEAGIFAYTRNIHGAMPNAIVVYFQGLPTKADWTPELQNPNAPRGWQVNTNATGSLNSRRDLAYVYKLINTHLINYVDTQNIFATGFSNGSRFVGVLWNDSSTNGLYPHSPLKAVAFNAAQAGNFVKNIQGTDVAGDNLFSNATPRSILMCMGKQDQVVEYNTQKLSLPIAKSLLSITQSTDDTVSQDITFNNLRYKTIIHNGAHDWPLDLEYAIAEFFNSQMQ
ncbi:MAG TPA: hypothetical protein VN030_02875 [Cellvibrio sp.]|nr:hypothetical protein [Cellvibrio sp.]